MFEPNHTAEALDRPGCVALLASVAVGRVVFTSRALPAVRPVPFVVRADAVCFRVPAADVGFVGALDTVVAFAVDDATPDRTARWYVTVLGRAREIHDERLVTELIAALPAGSASAPVTASGPDRCVCVPIETVFGHRVVPPARSCGQAAC